MSENQDHNEQAASPATAAIVGLDVGSTTVKAVVLGRRKTISS